MMTLTPTVAKGVEIAEAFLQREVNKRRRLNPNLNPEDLWAGVSFDGQIVIGTPLFHNGNGVYVDHNGHWKEA